MNQPYLPPKFAGPACLQILSEYEVWHWPVSVRPSSEIKPKFYFVWTGQAAVICKYYPCKSKKQQGSCAASIVTSPFDLEISFDLGRSYRHDGTTYK